MIPAQGAQLTVSNDSVLIHYSDLLAAIHGSDLEVPVAQITGVETIEPTTLTSGSVHLAGAGVGITFAPNQAGAVTDFVATVKAAMSGDVSGPSPIPGLDFVGFDVETANGDWGSICQLGVVRFIDGVEVAAESWLCAPPPGLAHFEQTNIDIHGITPDDVADQPSFAERLPQLAEFIGELPFVAHFAQFDATALHRACQAAGVATPDLHFSCSLTLARGEKLDISSHSLPFVAEHLDVELRKHHDATEDARACAGITVALARRHRFNGSLVEFTHDRGLTLGSLADDRVYPVLKDRSGAAIAIQQRKLAVGSPAEALVAEAGSTPVADPTDRPAADPDLLTEDQVTAEAAPKRSGGRGPAPWAAVATPDTIPEPNDAADPNGVLYGQHVTLSGDFEPFDKGQLWAGMAHLGATIGKNVTRKTTLLIAGAWATKTSKQKRAEELIDKGQDIKIWPAEDLYQVLGLDEQPPF